VREADEFLANTSDLFFEIEQVVLEFIAPIPSASLSNSAVFYYLLFFPELV